MDIPGLPKLANRQMRGTWKMRLGETRKWKAAVKQEAYLRWKGEPAPKVRLTLTRYSSVEPDFDGLVSSFKACIDGLVEAGVMAGDKRANVEAKYEWDKAAPGKGYVRIVIDEVLTTEGEKNEKQT
jgi:hypothetical protein